MLKKRKEYLEYRRNKKTAKRELARIAATALPAARELSEKSADITRFILKLSYEAKSLQGEQLLEMILSEAASILTVSQSQLLQTIRYLATLDPDDIRRLLVHSMAENAYDGADRRMPL